MTTQMIYESNKHNKFFKKILRGNNKLLVVHNTDQAWPRRKQERTGARCHLRYKSQAGKGRGDRDRNGGSKDRKLKLTCSCGVRRTDLNLAQLMLEATNELLISRGVIEDRVRARSFKDHETK